MIEYLKTAETNFIHRNGKITSLTFTTSLCIQPTKGHSSFSPSSPSSAHFH